MANRIVKTGGGGLPSGGTTNQVLKKLSNTDGDAGWGNESGSGAESVVYVTEKADIINQVLDSTKIYQLDANITLLSGESIIIPSGGLTIFGYGFDVTTVSKNIVGESIFTSPVGGSGNLISNFVQYISGDGSVFNITDLDGSHAIELNDVNFVGCSGLGEITDYRQFLGTTIGIYGCSDGFILSGSWTGFKMSNSNIFGFGSSGTLIKEGTTLTFSNRVFLELNFDFPTGAILSDLQNSNFSENELFQLNSCQAKLNSTIDQANATALLPNITANNPKCLWVGNIGLPDTATERFINTNDSGATHVIDWLYDTHEITMTEDCVFTESNLPANGLKTGEITIYLDTGGFEATLPSGWLNANSQIIGALKDNELNEIQVKFLSTDRYYIKINNTLTVYPAPDLSLVNPNSVLPNATNILVKLTGSFFTPASIVLFEGQDVIETIFISSSEIDVRINSGSVEGDFDISINNGTNVVFEDAIIVNQGIVTVPTESDWLKLTDPSTIDTTEGSKLKITALPLIGRAKWDTLVLDMTKDWIVEFTYTYSALGVDNGTNANNYVQLMQISDDTVVVKSIRGQAPFVEFLGVYQGIGGSNEGLKQEYRHINGQLSYWYAGSLIFTLGTQGQITENLYMQVSIFQGDYTGIRYIEVI